jgi:hypothetical protein
VSLSCHIIFVSHIFLGKFSILPSLVLLLFHFVHIPGLCAALGLGSLTSQLSTKMYICTSEPFDVISLVWWGPSPVVLSALIGTACTIHCQLTVNSFSFPRWADLSLGCLETEELAILQVSCFFNISPRRVVLSKNKIFSQSKTSKKLKL